MEEVKKKIESHPREASDYLPLFINEPWAEAFVRSAEKKHPGIFFYDLMRLGEKPEWAEQFFKDNVVAIWRLWRQP